MNTTVMNKWQTVNATDVRFRLGSILDELEKRKSPILVLSGSRPKAWLYPYEEKKNTEDLFGTWRKRVLPKYKKASVSELISLIRHDRDTR